MSEIDRKIRIHHVSLLVVVKLDHDMIYHCDDSHPPPPSRSPGSSDSTPTRVESHEQSVPNDPDVIITIMYFSKLFKWDFLSPSDSLSDDDASGLSAFWVP